MIDISGENVVLVGALLLFVAVMAGKVAYRFGAPALLLFLGVGMLFGLNFISYRSVEMTQFVGMIALCIILFTGGMDTKFSEIKPIIGPGVVLATVGVVMTAFVLAGFVWLVAPWLGIEIPFALALLLASTMSSTDSASVFSILRSKKQGLKQNLRPLLELESGSNDPMAYMMTILLISVVSNTSSGVGLGMSVVFFVVQMVVGALSGYLIGRLAVWTIKPLNLLLFGEEYAVTMGLNIRRSRGLLFLSTTLLAGTVTAFCGPIGFIGLAMPHVARMLFREADHRVLLPGTLLSGAAVLLLCDIVSKMFTLPVNAITALLGIPIVVWVVLRNKSMTV